MTTKKTGRFFLKSTALFLLVTFTLSSGPSAAYGGPLPVNVLPGERIQADPAQILNSLSASLFQELGSIQEIFIPETGRPPERLVLYLQDAHTQYDAQSNIRLMIAFFQKQYGLPLALMEGGEGRLDNLFFKSFPETELKEKILDEYLQKGELSGTEAASIMDEAGDTDYFGIETQAIYDESKQVFLEALQKEDGILKQIRARESEIETAAAKLFSPAVKLFHEEGKTFRAQKADLMHYLQVLRKLENFQFAEAYPELSKVLSAGRKSADPENFERALKAFCRTLEKDWMPRLPKQDQMRLGQLIQQARTGQGTGELMIQAEELLKKESLPGAIPVILKPAAQEARTLASIEGTKLFDELEALEEKLRQGLPKSEEEKRLLQEFRQLDLLKRLASLELSRKEWEELSSNVILTSQELKMTASARRFYALTLQRDEVLFQNMRSLMEKKKARVSVLVTGGFHSEGIRQKLREEKTPYILITPRIGQIPAKSWYRDVMQGRASYMKYFRRSLWDALARDYGSKLMALAPENERPAILKRWRDKIIQNAFAERRIAEASFYTRYVDTLSVDFRGKIERELDVFLSSYLRSLKPAPWGPAAGLAVDLPLIRRWNRRLSFPGRRSEVRSAGDEAPKRFSSPILSREEKKELRRRLRRLHDEMDKKMEPLRKAAEDPGLYKLTLREQKRFSVEFLKKLDAYLSQMDRPAAIEKAWEDARTVYEDMFSPPDLPFDYEQYEPVLPEQIGNDTFSPGKPKSIKPNSFVIAQNNIETKPVKAIVGIGLQVFDERIYGLHEQATLILAAHDGTIVSLQTFQDPATQRLVMVTGSRDNTIKIWREQEDGGFSVRILRGHSGGVYSLQVRTDRATQRLVIVSGSQDKTVKIWREQEDGDFAVTTLAGHTALVNSIEVIEDPQTQKLVIVSGSIDSTIRVWREQENGDFAVTELPEAPETSSVQVSIDPDTRRLTIVSGDWKKTIKIWREQENGSFSLITLDGHEEEIASIRILKDPRTQRLVIVSASWDATIKIWREQENGDFAVTSLSGHEGDVMSLLAFEDPKTQALVIISGSRDSKIKIWREGESGDFTVKTLPGHAQEVSALGAFEDSRGGGLVIVSGGVDKSIRIWREDEEKQRSMVKNGYEHTLERTARALDSNTPTLFIRSVDSLNNLERAFKSEKERRGNLEIETLTGTPFTDPAQIMGSMMPEEIPSSPDALAGDQKRQNLVFKKGVLYRLIEQAWKNPDKLYALKIDQIEAIPSKVWSMLNQFLLTGEIEVPETGEKLALPPNLRILAVMTEGAKLEDDAFYDRFVRKQVPPVSGMEFRELLQSKFNFSDMVVDIFFTAIHNRLEPEESLNIPQFLLLAYTIQGRILGQVSSKGSVRRRQYVEDIIKDEFNLFFGKGFDHYLEFDPASEASRELVIDGVELPLPEETRNQLADRLKDIPGDQQEEIIKRFLKEKSGLVITGDVMRALSAIARTIRYGNGVIRLEGPTGTGKTFIAEGLAKLLGIPFYGEPIHGQSKQDKWLGVLRSDEKGNYFMDSGTPFLRNLEQGGVTALSELNTAVKEDYAKLGWWLIPLAQGRREILLNEYPGEPTRMTRSLDSVVIIDINPDETYEARGKLPPLLEAWTPSVWIGGMQGRGELTEIAEGYLEGLPQEDVFSAAKMLAEFHFRIQEELNIPADKRGLSKNQPHILSIRELKRAAEYVVEHAGERTLEQNITKAWQLSYAKAFRDPEDQRYVLIQATHLIPDDRGRTPGAFLPFEYQKYKDVPVTQSEQTSVVSAASNITPQTEIVYFRASFLTGWFYFYIALIATGLAGISFPGLFGGIEAGYLIGAVIGFGILLASHLVLQFFSGMRGQRIKPESEIVEIQDARTRTIQELSGILKSHGYVVKSLQVSPDPQTGRFALITEGKNDSLQIWRELEPGKFEVKTLPNESMLHRPPQVIRDSKTQRLVIAAVTAAGQIKTWRELPDGSFESRLLPLKTRPDFLRIFNDVRTGRLVMISSDRKGTVEIRHELEGGRGFEVRSLQNRRGSSKSLEALQDPQTGKWVISGQGSQNLFTLYREQENGEFEIEDILHPHKINPRVRIFQDPATLKLILVSWDIAGQIHIRREIKKGSYSLSEIKTSLDIEVLQDAASLEILQDPGTGRLILMGGRDEDKTIHVFRELEGGKWEGKALEMFTPASGVHAYWDAAAQAPAFISYDYTNEILLWRDDEAKQLVKKMEAFDPKAYLGGDPGILPMKYQKYEPVPAGQITVEQVTPGPEETVQAETTERIAFRTWREFFRLISGWDSSLAAGLLVSGWALAQYFWGLEEAWAYLLFGLVLLFLAAYTVWNQRLRSEEIGKPDASEMKESKNEREASLQELSMTLSLGDKSKDTFFQPLQDANGKIIFVSTALGSGDSIYIWREQEKGIFRREILPVPSRNFIRAFLDSKTQRLVIVTSRGDQKIDILREQADGHFEAVTLPGHAGNTDAQVLQDPKTGRLVIVSTGGDDDNTLKIGREQADGSFEVKTLTVWRADYTNISAMLDPGTGKLAVAFVGLKNTIEILRESERGLFNLQAIIPVGYSFEVKSLQILKDPNPRGGVVIVAGNSREIRIIREQRWVEDEAEPAEKSFTVTAIPGESIGNFHAMKDPKTQKLAILLEDRANKQLWILREGEAGKFEAKPLLHESSMFLYKAIESPKEIRVASVHVRGDVKIWQDDEEIQIENRRKKLQERQAKQSGPEEQIEESLFRMGYPTLLGLPAGENPFRVLEAAAQKRPGTKIEKIRAGEFLDDVMLFGSNIIDEEAQAKGERAFKWGDGILPRLIREAQKAEEEDKDLPPDQRRLFVAAFENYHYMRPKMAVALNALLQEGTYYSPLDKKPLRIPSNLRFFAGVSTDVEMKLSPAEQSRWLRIYDESAPDPPSIPAIPAKFLKDFEEAVQKGIDLWGSPPGYVNTTNPEQISEYEEKIKELRRLQKEKGMTAEELNNSYTVFDSALRSRAELLILTQKTIDQESKIVEQWEKNKVAVMEGGAGTGIIATSQDAARRFGLLNYIYPVDEDWVPFDLESQYRFKEEKMVPDYEPDQDGHFPHARFLEAYTHGGVLIIDAQDRPLSPHLIEWVKKVAAGETEMKGTTVGTEGKVWKRHPDFHVIVATRPGTGLEAILEKEFIKRGNSVEKLNASHRVADRALRPKEEELLVPTEELLEIETQIVQAWEEKKIAILEGEPGGGKTDLAIDAAERFGLPVHVYSAHGRSSLSDWIGHYTQDAQGRFILTADPDDDGHFNIPFLEFLTHGGVFIIDEGAIGKRSQALLAWLTGLARGDQEILLNEQPGRPPRILKRHPNFHIIITTNPPDETPGRESIPLEILKSARRIQVSNDFNDASYEMILSRFYDLYLAQAQVPAEEHPDGRENWTRQQVRMHRFMRDFVRDEIVENAERHLFTLRDLRNWTKTFAALYPGDFNWDWPFQESFRLIYLRQFGEQQQKEIIEKLRARFPERGFFSRVEKPAKPMKYGKYKKVPADKIEDSIFTPAAAENIKPSEATLTSDKIETQLVQAVTDTGALITDERKKTLQELAATLTGHAKHVSALQIEKAPETGKLLIISGSGDETIKIWREEENGEFTVKTLSGHTASVIALQIQKNPETGKLTIVSGDGGGAIKIWQEQANGEFTVKTLTGHTASVYALQIQKDPETGKLVIVSGSEDKTLKIWREEASGDYTVKTLPGHTRGIYALQIHEDPVTHRLVIVSGGGDKTLKVWREQENGDFSVKTLSEHAGPVTSLQIREDPVTHRLVIVSGGGDKTLKVWREQENGDFSVKTLSEHAGPVTSLQIREDPRTKRLMIVSGSMDQTLKIWREEASGDYTVKTLPGHTSGIYTLQIHEDPVTHRLVIISGSSDKTLKIWREDEEEQKKKSKTPKPPQKPVKYAKYKTVPADQMEDSIFTPAAPELATPSEELLTSDKIETQLVEAVTDSGAVITDERKKTLQELAAILAGHKDSVISVQVLREGDGRLVIISGSFDGTIKIWREKEGGGYSVKNLSGHKDGVTSLQVLREGDGKLVIFSGGIDGTIKIWREDEGGNYSVKILAGHQEDVASLQVLKEGDGKLVIVSGGMDGKIKIWREEEGGDYSVRTLDGHQDTIKALQVLREGDGRLVIVSGSADGTIKIWREEEGGNYSVKSLLGYKDGVASLRVLREGDGKLVIVSGGIDGKIKVWREDAYGNYWVKILAGHQEDVESLQVLRAGDGKLVILSGGGDGTIKIWREEKGGGYSVKNLPRHTYGVASLQVLREEDGSLVIVSGSTDGIIKIWREDEKEQKEKSKIRKSPGTFKYAPLQPVPPDQIEDSTFILAAPESVMPSEAPWKSGKIETYIDQALEAPGAVVTDARLKTLQELTTTLKRAGGESHDLVVKRSPQTGRLIVAAANNLAGTIDIWREHPGGRFTVETLTAYYAGTPSLDMILDDDGRLLIVSGGGWGEGNPTIKIWRETAEGSFELKTLPGHRFSVKSIRALRDDKGRLLIVSAGSDDTVKVLREQAGGDFEVKTFPSGHKDPVTQIQADFDDQGRLVLVTGGNDSVIKIWQEREDGNFERHNLIGHEETVTSIQMRRDGQGRLLIVSGSHDYLVKIWQEQEDGSYAVKTLMGHQKGVNVVQMDQDDEGNLMIVSGTISEGDIRIWHKRPDGGFDVRVLPGHAGYTSSIAIERDKEGVRTIVSTGLDRIIKFWREDEEEKREKYENVVTTEKDEFTERLKEGAIASEESVKSDLKTVLDLGFHGLLLLEPGAREQKILLDFSSEEGYEAFDLESSPEMTILDLLGGLFPIFEGEEALPGRELRMKPGFLTRHMGAAGAQKKLLIIHNLDALPERVRAALNNFLLKGYIEYKDDSGKVTKLRLPENVKIVATLSKASQREFASAFFNRFVKLDVPAPSAFSDGFSELLQLLMQDYGLSEKEARRVQNIYLAIKKLEAGGQFWPSGKDYRFSIKEALLHGQFIAFAKKEKSLSPLDDVSVKRMIADEALRVYGSRLQEHAKDYANFVEVILKTYLPHEAVQELTGEVLVGTEGRPQELSGVPVRAVKRPAQVDSRFRLTLRPKIVRPLASILRGWQAGKMVSLVGETGVAKTTMGVFLAELLGMESYIYSTHGESKARELMLTLQMTQEGIYKLQMREFLKRIQKGNQVLILDEANLRPEILWVLNGIARGEKEFTVEVPGEQPVKVKLGENVHFLLTMNPESYAGRGEIPAPFLENVFKMWAETGYSPEDIEEILEGFFTAEEEKIFRQKMSLLAAQAKLREGFANRTIEDILQMVEEDGHEALRMIPPAELAQLEKEILARPDVQRKMEFIRSKVAITAPDVQIIFTMRGWWSQSMDGKVITVPLYELVNPERSREAVLGLIIHELRHKRFSPTRKEMQEVAEEIGQRDAIGAPAFHSLWNVVEDVRIDHTHDPSREGERPYIDAMNQEFFHQPKPMTENQKQKNLEAAAVNPARIFLNELIGFGYTGKHSEIFDKLPQEIQEAVRQIVERGENSLLFQAALDANVVMDFEGIEQGVKNKQEEKIRAATESLKILAEKIYPVYDALVQKSQSPPSGEEGPGMPQFIEVTAEQLLEMLNNTSPGGLPPGTSAQQIILQLKGEMTPELKDKLTQLPGRPADGPEEGEETGWGDPGKNFMSDEDRDAEMEAHDQAVESGREKRTEEMKTEPFNLRLAEVSNDGKRLAKGLIESFRVPEEPEIEESATGRILNPIRYLLRNQEPFDEEVESIGKPDLAVLSVIDTSGSMYNYLPALKKMLAILMASFAEIGKKKVDYGLSFITDVFDPVKGFKDKYTLGDLNQKQGEMEAWMDAGGRKEPGSGIHLFNAVSGIIQEFRSSSKKNKLALVITDGGDTGGDLRKENGKPVPSERLKQKLDEAKRLGIEIVGIGLNTEDTKVFGHFIQIDPDKSELLVEALLKIAKRKAVAGSLPPGDLAESLGIKLHRMRSELRLASEAVLKNISQDLLGLRGHPAVSVFDVLKVVEEKHGIPLDGRNALAITDILNAEPAANVWARSEAGLEGLLSAAFQEKRVIEYQFSEKPAQGEDPAALEDFFQTAKDFLAVSPRSEIRLVVQSRSRETELRRLWARVLGDEKQDRLMILNSSKGGITADALKPADMILTLNPGKAVRDSGGRYAFDLSRFADGMAAEDLLPARALSGAIAALLKEQVEGVVRKDNIVQFLDAKAASGFDLFIGALAAAARAEARAAQAA